MTPACVCVCVCLRVCHSHSYTRGLWSVAGGLRVLHKYWRGPTAKLCVLFKPTPALVSHSSPGYNGPLQSKVSERGHTHVVRPRDGRHAAPDVGDGNLRVEGILQRIMGTFFFSCCASIMFSSWIPVLRAAHVSDAREVLKPNNNCDVLNGWLWWPCCCHDALIVINDSIKALLDRPGWRTLVAMQPWCKQTTNCVT